MRVSHDPKTGIHRVLLEHGGVCIMQSDPAGGPTRSFQRLAKHQVPLYPRARGARLNWTIRTTSPHVLAHAPGGYAVHPVGEGLTLALASWPLDADTLRDLHAELRAAMDEHGAADVTTAYGNTSTNAGRKILEMACVEGQQYTYAGKKTPPGKAFGPVARRVLEYFVRNVFFGERVAEGDAIADLWAHLIFYPSADTCKLAWHSDSESGLNSHIIASVTFLEDPVHGARPFDVRLKSVEAANKAERKLRGKQVKAEKKRENTLEAAFERAKKHKE